MLIETTMERYELLDHFVRLTGICLNVNDQISVQVTQVSNYTGEWQTELDR